MLKHKSVHPGQRQGATWTKCQPIAGPHRDKQPFSLTFTPVDSLDSPIGLTWMFLDWTHTLCRFLHRRLTSCRLAGAAPPGAVLWAAGHHAVGPQLSHRSAHLADLQPGRLLQAAHPPLQSHGCGARLAEQRQRRQGERRISFTASLWLVPL